MNWVDHRLCLLVSRRCNIRCGFCPVEFTGEDMSLETASKAVKSYLEHLSSGISPKIKFFGGEPFLNWPVMKALVDEFHGKRSKISFQVSTNGMFLDEEKISYLLAHPELEVTLSFRTKNGWSLPGVWFTFVLTQNQSTESVIEKMNVLILEGYRRFNLIIKAFIP